MIIFLIIDRTIAFQRNAIKDFLVAAHQSYFAKENNELLIFHAKSVQTFSPLFGC